jgi:hypothetical protein
MNRVNIAIMMLAAGSLPVSAQRLDGCPENETPVVQGVIHAVSRETRDRGLQEAGFALDRGSLAIALRDPRADVRSLAALKLGEVGQRADVASIMQAWLSEKDTCTRGKMDLALSMLVPELAWDAGQHPGGQLRIAPFQACTVSEPLLVTLTIEQVAEPGAAGPAVRVSARNRTPQTLAFARAPSPTELFSVTVLDPTGAPAKVTKGQEWMYEPAHSLANAIDARKVAYLALPSQEDISWTWRIGDDFDMSVPGTYRVSMGGRIGYLDTTVCSNTAEVTVGN